MNEDLTQGSGTPTGPEPGPQGESQPPQSQPEQPQQPQSTQGQPQQAQPPPPPQQTAGPYYPGPPPGGYFPPPPPPPPADRRRLRWLIPASLAIGCLPWVILFAMLLGAVATGASRGIGGNHIALVRVSGVITAGKSGASLFGDRAAGSEDLVAQLEKARKDDSAKAILIRINSPGGSAAGSEEVYNEIIRVRRSGKPIYASMGDVAASGGYYIASACDRIYTDGGTLTGSIGVIFETTDMSALFNKIGFRPEVTKSGKFKDIGSPNRPLTPEEKLLLQGMVDDIYNRFVKAVSDGRKMPVSEVRKIADGRIFTGSQAVKVKLVDEVGGMRDATLAAARAGGIKGEPRVVEYARRGFFDILFNSTGEASSQVDRAVNRALMDELLRRGGPAR